MGDPKPVYKNGVLIGYTYDGTSMVSVKSGAKEVFQNNKLIGITYDGKSMEALDGYVDPVKKKEPSPTELAFRGLQGLFPSIAKDVLTASKNGAAPSKSLSSGLVWKESDDAMAGLLQNVKHSPQTQADIDRQAKFQKAIQPDLVANQEQFDEDPVSTVNRIVMSKTPSIKNRSVNISSTKVDTPLQKQIAEKEDKPVLQDGEISFSDADKKIKEVRNHFANNTNTSLEHLIKLTGATNGDQLYDDRFDKQIQQSIRPGNETDRIAYDRLQDAKKARSAVVANLQNGKGFEDMAIDLAAANSPATAKIVQQLRNTPDFGEMVQGKTSVSRSPDEAFGNATMGRFMYDFLSSSAVAQEVARIPGMTQKFRNEAVAMLDKYPEFGKMYLGQRISQKMEDLGMNNSILNVATKAERDKAVAALEKDGQITPAEKRFYEENIRPLSGLGLLGRKVTGNPVIDTPGFLENAVGGAYQGFKSIPKGLYELTGAKDAVLGGQGALRKDLESSNTQIGIKPKGLVHEIVMNGGQFLGQSTSIGAGGNLLKTLKIANNPRTAMGIMGGVQAYANYMPTARLKFPGDELKQRGFATILSGIEMGTENIFNDRKVLDGMLGKLKPGVAETIKDFTAKKISSEAAREQVQSLIGKVLRDIPDVAKYFSKGVAQNTIEEVTAQLGQQATEGVFTNKPFEDWIDGEDLWKTARLAALGSGFIAALSTRADMQKNRGITAKNIYTMAQDPEYWKQQITEGAKVDEALAAEAPDKIKNLDHAAKVLEELGQTDMTEKQKVKFLITELEKKLKGEQSEDATVKAIHGNAIKGFEQVQQDLLEGKDDGSIEGDNSDDLTPDETKAVKLAAKEGLPGMYGEIDPLDALKEISYQAQGVGIVEGDPVALEGGGRIEDLSKMGVSEGLIEAAVKAFPSPLADQVRELPNENTADEAATPPKGNGALSNDGGNRVGGDKIKLDPDLVNIDPTIQAARNGDKEAQQKLEKYGLDWEQTTTYRFVGQSEVDVLLSDNKVESKRFTDAGIDVTTSPKVTSAANNEYRVTFKESFDVNNGLGKVKIKSKEEGDHNLEKGRGYDKNDIAKIEKIDENGNVVETIYEQPLKEQPKAETKVDGGNSVGGDVDFAKRKKEMQSEYDKLQKERFTLAKERDEIIVGGEKYRTWGKKQTDEKINEIRNKQKEIDEKQTELRKELKVIEAKERGEVGLFDYYANHGSTNTVLYDIKEGKLFEVENITKGKTREISIEDAAKNKFANTQRGRNQKEINEAYTDKVKAKYEAEINAEIVKYKAVEQSLKEQPKADAPLVSKNDGGNSGGGEVEGELSPLQKELRKANAPQKLIDAVPKDTKLREGFLTDTKRLVESLLGLAGNFSIKENKVRIGKFYSSLFGGRDKVLIHEAAHAATMSVYGDILRNEGDYTKEQVAAARELNDIAWKYLENTQSWAKMTFPRLYGTTNPYEFIAEFIANPKFRDYVSKNSPDKKTNIATYIWDGILKMLGVKKSEINQELIDKIQNGIDATLEVSTAKNKSVEQSLKEQPKAEQVSADAPLVSKKDGGNSVGGALRDEESTTKALDEQPDIVDNIVKNINSGLIGSHYGVDKVTEFSNEAQLEARKQRKGYTTEFGDSYVFPRTGHFFFIGDAPEGHGAKKQKTNAILDIKNPLDLTKRISGEDTGKIIDFVKTKINRPPSPGMAGSRIKVDMIGGIKNAKENGIEPQQLMDFISDNFYAQTKGHYFDDILKLLGKDGIIFDANSSGTSLIERKSGRGDGKKYKVAVAVDPKQIKVINSKNISKLYHKAKSDGSNPAFVKAVEQSLKEQPNADTKNKQIKQQAKEESQPTNKPDEKSKVGKYEAKAREVADKIMKSELPDWMKADLPEGTKKQGGGYDELKKALADAVITMGKLLDKGVEFKDAVKEAVNDIVKLLGEDKRATIEKGFAEDYKKQTDDNATPPPKEGKREDEGGGITHAANEVRRQQRGLPEYQKSPTTEEALMTQAEQMLKDGYDVEDLMNRLEKGETPEPVENFIRKIYVATLDAEIAKNPTDELLAKQKRFAQVGDLVNSKLGLNLWSLKGQGSPLQSISDFYVAKMEAAGVDKLTEQQKKETKEAFDNVQKADANATAAMEAYREEIAKLKAENEILRQKRESKKPAKPVTKEDFIAQRKSLKDKLKQQFEDFKAEGQKLGAKSDGGLGSTIITYKMAKTIGEIAKSHIDEVGVNLKEVVRKTFEDIKDLIEGVTEKDIHDVLAGEYNEKKPTRNELAAKMRDLKDEAFYINKLERLLKGEQPKSENKKVERNRQITELQKKIKDFQKEQALSDAEMTAKLKTIKTQNENQTAKIKERITKGDFETKKQIPFLEDPEMRKKFPKEYNAALDAIKKKEDAKHEFDIALFRDEMSRRTLAEKATDNLSKAVGTVKAITTGIDDSAVAIQTYMSMLIRPRTGARAFYEHIRQGASQKKFDRWLTALHSSSDFKEMKDMGLDVTEPSSLNEREKEEIFNNRFDGTIKVKGKEYKLIGAPLKPFERAFTTLGNVTRVVGYRTISAKYKKDGYTVEKNPELFKSLATRLNTETGRGKVNEYVDMANKVITMGIWSPKLMATKFNILGITDVASIAMSKAGTKGYYRQLHPKERLAAIRDIGQFALTVMALSYGFALANGGEIDDDPLSSTFMDVKLKNGKSYNFTGGFSGYIRAICQFAAGKKNKDGQSIATGRLETAGRFFRGKTPPITSAIVDLAAGKDFMGKPTNVVDEVIGLSPISLKGIFGQIQSDGGAAFFSQGIPTFFGFNVKNEKDYKSQGNTITIKDAEKGTKRQATPEEMKEYGDLKEKKYQLEMDRLKNQYIELDRYGDVIVERKTRKNSEGKVVEVLDDFVPDGEGKSVPYRDLTPELLKQLDSKIKKQMGGQAKKQIFGDGQDDD